MNDVVTADPNMMHFIERAARDENFSVEKFGELLRMQREMEHDQARRAFNQAMAITQADMPPVVRSATNKHLGNKYAKLEDVDREMRPIYTAHGFSVRFGSAPAPEGYIRITCTVAHASGYFEENYLDAPTNNVGSQGGRTATTGVQAVGSAVTYLRRYLLGMVFNIVLADDDDDGEGTRRGTRDAINDATPMQPLRSAAAATPRPERRAGPVYEPDVEYGPLDEQDGRKWLLNLDVALANAQSQDEVVQIGGHSSVGHATASAPEHVKRRVSELLAQAYARFAEPDADADTGEVHIRNEEKLAAGN